SLLTVYAAPHTHLLSLQDAVPILLIALSSRRVLERSPGSARRGPASTRVVFVQHRDVLYEDDPRGCEARWAPAVMPARRRVSFRSEEHTSELQSRENLLCRLLLEK